MLTIKRLLCGLPALLLPLFAFAYLSNETTVRAHPAARHAFGVTARPVPQGIIPDFRAPRRMANADVVARVMSFDNNHDGQVGRDELLERMQGLMQRDANGDGTLTRDEIMSGTQPPRASGPVRGFGTAQYGFDEESEDASRAHITGALADLKLPKRTYARASAVVNRFLDERVRQASPPPHQQQAIATEPRVVVRMKNGQRTRVLTAFRSSPRMPRLQPAEQSQLAADLAALLTDEQCSDFVAAISRRPIKKVSLRSAFAPPNANERRRPSPERTVISGAELRLTNDVVVSAAVARPLSSP